MASQYQPADLSDEQLEQLRHLEKDLGKVVVAVEPQPQYAELSDAALSNLKNAEKKLGVIMIAYEND